jgi:hypothetical protein
LWRDIREISSYAQGQIKGVAIRSTFEKLPPTNQPKLYIPGPTDSEAIASAIFETQVREKHGRTPRVTFAELVVEMVREDLKSAGRDEPVKRHSYKAFDYFE